MVNKTKTFIMALILLPAIATAQQFQPLSSNNPESRWSFSLNGGYEKNRIELQTATLSSEINGEIVSEIELLDKDKIDYVNSIMKSYQRSGYLFAGVEYRIIKGLSVYAGAGAVKLSEYAYSKENDIDLSVPFDKFSFRYSVGLKYQWDINQNWFLMISPQFSQTIASTSKLHFGEDVDKDLQNMRLSKSMISWNIPLIGGYRIGKFVPYLGAQYRDFRYTSVFKYDTVYVGEVATNNEKQESKPMNYIEGIAGISYQIIPKLSLNVTAIVSDSWKIQGGISYNL